MTWTQPFQVLRPSGPFADLDRHRAWRPSVLQGDGSVLRMWYAGHDGSTARVLAAEQFARYGWTRLGASIDPGFAGSTDAAGVGAPSVVHTADGYLMAYAGSDGTETRVHLATSADADTWQPGGPFLLGGRHVAATSPCLVTTPDCLWLYYAAAGDDGRTAIHAATSVTSATSVVGGARDWHHVGSVLGPGSTERSVSEPWVVAGERGLLMFFVTHDGADAVVGVATSGDGVMWARRPNPLDFGRRHHDTGSIGGPSALRFRGGRLRLWYAAGDEGDEAGHCRLWSTDLNGRRP
jgi:predicted GH43/DUF377 family glycosyl hydrolase